MKQKRRPDINKLVSKAREVWRQSEKYQFVKKTHRVDGKPGWFKCCRCKGEVEVIKIDHIEPIGNQPDQLSEFGSWLPKLFCETTNLQGLCNRCHKEKTKLENKIRRSHAKV